MCIDLNLCPLCKEPLDTYKLSPDKCHRLIICSAHDYIISEDAEKYLLKNRHQVEYVFGSFERVPENEVLVLNFAEGKLQYSSASLPDWCE